MILHMTQEQVVATVATTTAEAEKAEEEEATEEEATEEVAEEVAAEEEAEEEEAAETIDTKIMMTMKIIPFPFPIFPPSTPITQLPPSPHHSIPSPIPPGPPLDSMTPMR
jgi:hypothetical protein